MRVFTEENIAKAEATMHAALAKHLTDPSWLGVTARLMHSAHGTLQRAVLHEIERGTDANALLEGLERFTANALVALLYSMDIDTPARNHAADAFAANLYGLSLALIDSKTDIIQIDGVEGGRA